MLGVSFWANLLHGANSRACFSACLNSSWLPPTTSPIVSSFIFVFCALLTPNLLPAICELSCEKSFVSAKVEGDSGEFEEFFFRVTDWADYRDSELSRRLELTQL